MTGDRHIRIQEFPIAGIRVYQRHGFELAPPERARDLLQTYWTIPERQIETSVVLTRETRERGEREPSNGLLD